MKVLFIGGTGVISSACSELAFATRHRPVSPQSGQAARPSRPAPRLLLGDIRDSRPRRAALAGHTV